MHTFLCYRREMLNDPQLQITWKSYASSCKDRGVFFTLGPRSKNKNSTFVALLGFPELYEMAWSNEALKSSQCGLRADF